MAAKLRELKVNLDDIAFAMEQDPAMGLRSLFDTETGEAIILSEEEFGIVETLYEEHASFDEESLDLAAILAESDYPEWQHAVILQAEQIEEGYGSRYIELPDQDSRAGYRDMEAFIPTVDDRRFKSLLQQALDGKSPFRRFKDVVESDHRIRQRWFAFSDERRRERVRVWLEFIGIKAIHLPPPLPEVDPSTPSPRQRLLQEVLLFTAAARQLPGVIRIALIGSLTTDEPDPKDADLLVTVAGDMELEQLALLGRKLSGHAQGFNRGGEVFLADRQGNYLGRICRWKKCEPFVRARCEAQNCAQRQYLNDDLQNVRLKKELIAEPPVTLWPQIVTHVPVPEDLQRLVLAQL